MLTLNQWRDAMLMAITAVAAQREDEPTSNRPGIDAAIAAIDEIMEAGPCERCEAFGAVPHIRRDRATDAMIATSDLCFACVEELAEDETVTRVHRLGSWKSAL